MQYISTASSRIQRTAYKRLPSWSLGTNPEDSWNVDLEIPALHSSKLSLLKLSSQHLVISGIENKDVHMQVCTASLLDTACLNSQFSTLFSRPWLFQSNTVDSVSIFRRVPPSLLPSRTLTSDLYVMKIY